MRLLATSWPVALRPTTSWHYKASCNRSIPSRVASLALPLGPTPWRSCRISASSVSREPSRCTRRAWESSERPRTGPAASRFPSCSVGASCTSPVAPSTLPPSPTLTSWCCGASTTTHSMHARRCSSNNAAHNRRRHRHHPASRPCSCHRRPRWSRPQRAASRPVRRYRRARPRPPPPTRQARRPRATRRRRPARRAATTRSRTTRMSSRRSRLRVARVTTATW